MEKRRIVAVASVKVSSEEQAGIEILDCIFPYDPKAKYNRTRFPGIILISSELNPHRIMEILNRCIISQAYRITPVERVIKWKLQDIIKIIIELASIINKRRTFKVQCKLRGIKGVKREAVIRKIADEMKEKLEWSVDLENPSHIIVVEGLGDRVGIAVVEREEIWDRRRIMKRFMKSLSPNSLL